MKVKVVANKTWEVDPLLNALLNPTFNAVFDPRLNPDYDLSVSPSECCYPTAVTPPPPARWINQPQIVALNHPPLYRQGSVHLPRLVYQINNPLRGEIDTVEIWCIQDQMNPDVSGSSTNEKIRVLPNLINAHDETDLVIAFGTAGHPEPGNNGCVATGANFFIYSGDDPSNNDPWDGCIDGISYRQQILSGIDGASGELLAVLFDDNDLPDVAAKFLTPPLVPAENLCILSDPNQVAVSDINIINYKLYGISDPLAVAQAEKYLEDGQSIASVETTHGTIAATTLAYSNAPVIFVTAITDQVGQFDREVNNAQNYVAAFNGGIYLSYLLNRLTGCIE